MIIKYYNVVVLVRNVIKISEHNAAVQIMSINNYSDLEFIQKFKKKYPNTSLRIFPNSEVCNRSIPKIIKERIESNSEIRRIIRNSKIENIINEI